MSAALTRSEVLRRAWPIILANATLPLLGLVDTAVIGNVGSLRDLGAIALSTLVFNFLYFALGFLRMSTTGFVAQAAGTGDEPELRASIGRALLIALAVGTLLVALKHPVAWTALQLLHGSGAVEQLSLSFIEVRLWGAPAELATQAFRGALIGLGKGRDLLLLELSVNLLNLALNVGFVAGLHWGATGVALGTACAEWFGALLFAWILTKRLRERRNDTEPLVPWPRLLHSAPLRAMLHANADILLRTLFLLLGFAFFTDQGARFGDSVLAGNHILLQFITFSAFFLDGFANVAENLVGAAIGARQRGAFDAAVRRSSELAVVSAVVLSGLLWSFGHVLIGMLTNLTDVRAAARSYLPFAALYVLLSVGAFQLDGIFIGATRTRAMRNASLVASAIFLTAAVPLSRSYQNDGLWSAFILFVLARSATLSAYYPALRRSISPVDDHVNDC
jgi:MATE family multidrug resistance protein